MIVKRFYCLIQKDFTLTLPLQAKSQENAKAVQEAIEKSMSCAENGLHNEAIDHFNTILKIIPDETIAILGKGISLNKLGRHKEAIECFDNFLRLEKGNKSPAYKHKGASLLSIGKIPDAIISLEEAIKAEAKDIQSITNLGICHFNQNKSKEAVSCFIKAIELNQDYAIPYLYIGLIFMNLGKQDSAIQSFKRGIEIDPKNDSFYINLAICHNMLGKKEEALDFFNKAINLSPANSKYLIAKAVFLAQQQKYVESNDEIEKAIKLSPKEQILYQIKGKNLQDLKRFKDAILCYDEALKLGSSTTVENWKLQSLNAIKK